MIKAPQTLASEVFHALNVLMLKGERFWDWGSPEVQEIVRAAMKLQKVDARAAFSCLGATAAICGNLDDVSEYYRKALHLPDVSDTQHEYWVSLGNAAAYKQCREIGSWLLDPKRGFFPRIWEKAVSGGHILEVWNRLPDAMRTYPQLSITDFSFVEEAAVIMKERGLTDDDVVLVLDLMGEIQRAHRIMYSGNLVSLLKVMRPPEDPPYLYLTVPLNAGLEELHTMNRKLARVVVERLPGGAFPLGMVTSFSKVFPVELRAAA